MKGNLKRSVAGILASLMLFSSVSISNAANFTDVKSEDMDIVNKVVASSAMIGTDKGFEGTKELTRAEVVAIMVRLKGITEATVKASSGATNYKDVPSSHWASGYINVASSLGITVGVGEGKFAPDQVVSYVEVAAMLTRAIGGGVIAELDGTWPTNYMNFAMEEGITDGVYKATLASVNRLETAQMVVNALTSPMWVKSGGSTGGTLDYSKDETKTLLGTALNLTQIEDKTLSDINMSDSRVTIDGKDYEFDESLSFNVEEGMKVDAWLDKKDNLIWIGKAEDSEQKVVEFTSIKSSDITVDNTDDDSITLYVNGSAKEYDLIDTADRDTQVSINGISKSLTDLVAAINTAAKRENTSGKFITEDGKIVKILLSQFDEVMVVSKVSEEKIYNDNDVISHSNEDLKGKDYIITDENGKIMKVSDLEEGMTLLFAKENSVYRMMALDNTVTGRITEKSSTGSYIKIDGKKYEINKFVNPDLQDLKDDVKLYLDKNGKVIICELEEAEVDSNLGIITEAAGIINSRGEISAEVEITLLDGTKMAMKELDIEEMEEKFENEDLFANDTVAHINEQLYDGGEASDLLGQMVRFKVSGDKVEIVEFESGFKAYDGTDLSALAKSYSDTEAKLVNIAGYKIDKDSNKLTKSGEASYRINNNTVVILENDSDTKAYSTDAEIIDFASLKTTSNVSMTLAKVDEDTNTVKYMYIREDQNVARETSDNYGIITEVAETNEDDEFNLTILSNQGEKELLATDGTAYDDSYIGKLVAYTENDGKIVGIEVRDTSFANLTEAKLGKFNDGTIKLSKQSTPTVVEVLDSMSEVVFLSAESITKDNGNSKFVITGIEAGDESDITLMGTNKNFTTADDDATTIYFAKLDTDDDGSYDDEIGIIIYVRE